MSLRKELVFNTMSHQLTHRLLSRKAGLRLAACSGWLLLISIGLPPAVIGTETALMDAAAQSQEWSAALRWENDTLAGSDRYYTHGMALTVAGTGKGWVDPLADWVWGEESRRTVAYELGQLMYTPLDTDSAIPDPNDRPYAGLLYGAVSLHLERDHYYHGLKVMIGVVGPGSGAENTQDLAHELITSDRDQGWNSQLHNEPIFNLIYEHRRKYLLYGEDSGWVAEALPYANAMVGNYLTQGQVGTQFRVGRGIPDDFGTSLLRGMGFLPPPRWTNRDERAGLGYWFHAGVSGLLVLQNITLDGNTGQSSPEVDRRGFVPMAEIGAGLGNRRLQASLSYVFLGKKFDGQAQDSLFAALNVSYFF